MNDTPLDGALLAAVDLGSNSFRLEIARYQNGQLHRVDYLKEAVRQGGDLDEQSNLSQDAIERGVKCLARFGERLKGFPKAHVRAVATQTLREAKNRNEFLALARKALGYRVEVISGLEEARLIHQGVSHFLPQSDEKRLVLDIGGRSTELMIGQHFKLAQAHSMHVGSVAWSLKYFAAESITENDFNRAEIAAISILDAVASQYDKTHWDTAYGASGTVGAVSEILAANKFSEDYVDREGLMWLRKKLIEFKYVEKFNLEGLREDRKAVICGGVAILGALLELLNIDKLYVAKGALRHGLLYDMIAHETHEDKDMRAASVHHAMQRYLVDVPQAERVQQVALHFFDQLAPQRSWEQEELETTRQTLEWAAKLHEIGSIISHIDANQHGAYILEHTEMSGFAQHELHLIGQLVLGQDGKLKKVESEFEDKSFVLALFCLRLAAIVCHARVKPQLADIKLSLNRKTFTLYASDTWRIRFPQTQYLLEEEAAMWQKTTWRIEFSN